MGKKDFPLTVHKDLNNIRKKFSKNLSSTNTSVPLMIFRDLDDSSNFFFQINNFKLHNGEFYYDITYNPINEDDLRNISKLLKFPDLEKRIQNWTEVIAKFDETPHYSEDPVVEKYAEEYYDEFKLIEDDADNEPFDLKRQIIIDNYLEKAIIFLESYEADTGEDLSEPKIVAIELKRSLTRLTKDEVVKKLSKLWAIARKKGIPILKEVFFEFAKDVVISFGKQWLGLP